MINTDKFCTKTYENCINVSVYNKVMSREELLSPVLLVILLVALETVSLPALPVTVLAVLNLGVLDTVRVTPALLGADVLTHPARHGRLARDRRFGEQTLVFLELSVPLVRSNIRLGGSQISIKQSLIFTNFLERVHMRYKFDLLCLSFSFERFYSEVLT